MADVRDYTFTPERGLVEDATTAATRDELLALQAEPDAERALALLQASQMAAAALGAALTWSGGSVRLRVTTDAAAGTVDVQRLTDG